MSSIINYIVYLVVALDIAHQEEEIKEDRITVISGWPLFWCDATFLYINVHCSQGKKQRNVDQVIEFDIESNGNLKIVTLLQKLYFNMSKLIEI